MNETIKTKAQELYPIESRANEHTAFLQGAEAMLKTIRLGIADILEKCSLDELTEICSATDKMQEVLRKYKKIVNND